MPLMHSEDIKHVEQLLKFYETWKRSIGDKYQDKLDTINQSSIFAQKHYDILEKFGRYPHRNVALDRISTPEEEEYLKNGDSFGQ